LEIITSISVSFTNFAQNFSINSLSKFQIFLLEYNKIISSSNFESKSFTDVFSTISHLFMIATFLHRASTSSK